MRTNHLKIFFLILILLSFLLLFYFTNKGTFYGNRLKDENENLLLYLNAKSQIEGKYIWDLNLLSKQIFIDSLSQKDDSYQIYFWYDSIGCARCYDFHLYNIKNFFDEDRCVIIYNNEFSFMKKDFNKARFINCLSKKQKYKQLVLLVDNKGRILYADFPQFEQLEGWGEYFYTVSSKYK